jgi:hypothetical protein
LNDRLLGFVVGYDVRSIVDGELNQQTIDGTMSNIMPQYTARRANPIIDIFSVSDEMKGDDPVPAYHCVLGNKTTRREYQYVALSIRPMS